MAERHITGQEEVKEITLKMVVNIGACMMTTNETILAQLGLLFKKKENQ